MNKIWSSHSPSSGGRKKQTLAKSVQGYKGGKQYNWQNGYFFFYNKNRNLDFLPWFPTQKFYFLFWFAHGDPSISGWFFLVRNISVRDLTTTLASTLEHSLTKRSFTPASIIDFLLFHHTIWSITVFILSCVHCPLYNILWHFTSELLSHFATFIFTY